MTATKRLLGLLLAGYAVLLGLISWADWQGRQFNNPDSKNRDGFNPHFAPGSYQTPASLPLLFPPNAHLALAEQAAVDGRTELARRHALDTLRHNPASGEAALMLLDLYSRPQFYYVPPDLAADDPAADDLVEDDPAADDLADTFPVLQPADKQMADRFAAISYQLRPTYLATLGTLADYWTAHNNLERALPIWADLLVNHRSSATEAFPLFHAALDSPTFTDTLARYIESPPVWWPEFFNYLLVNETDAKKIQQLYLARAHSSTPPTPAERDNYANHLSKQGHWQLAYDVWADHLAEQAGSRQQLFDGGFEDINNLNQLFTWKITPPPKTIKIEQSHGMGVTGKRALHITFRKGAQGSTPFKHVSQLRMLPTGNYRLQGRIRLSQLITTKGLRWRVYCAATPTLIQLGESEAFKGHSAEWKNFQFEISVPTDCPTQLFSLESDSHHAHHNVFTGEIWFDDLNLTQNNTHPQDVP